MRKTVILLSLLASIAGTANAGGAADGRKDGLIPAASTADGRKDGFFIWFSALFTR